MKTLQAFWRWVDNEKPGTLTIIQKACGGKALTPLARTAIDQAADVVWAMHQTAPAGYSLRFALDQQRDDLRDISLALLPALAKVAERRDNMGERMAEAERDEYRAILRDQHQPLADANARQAGQLLAAQQTIERLVRGRKCLVECNLLMNRKLDRIGDVVGDIIDDVDGPAVTGEQLLAERICKELQVVELDFKHPEPVHIAFHFRDQKRPDGYYDALPGDGFAFLGAAPKWLALQFDCGGVHGCANITYDYLRAVLDDPRSDSPVQLTERVKT